MTRSIWSWLMGDDPDELARLRGLVEAGDTYARLLEAQTERYRGGLAFYAAAESWKVRGMQLPAVDRDQGRRAREALGIAAAYERRGAA